MSVSLPVRPREDNLPLWVIILLVFFGGLQVFRVAEPLLGARVARHLVSSPDSGLSSEAMQDLVEADVQAKTAFAATYGQPGAVVAPNQKTLAEALREAERLQRESHNMPGAARRVLLLRALLDKAPLLPADSSPSPLAAFDRDLPPSLRPSDRAQFVAEGRLWQSVFGPTPLSPNQAAAAATQIRALPNIRWWKYPALIALSKSQGDLSEANRYAKEAREQAVPALTGTVILGLLRFALILLGIVLLLWLSIAGHQKRKAEKERSQLARSTPAFELWPNLPSPVAPADRRLGAGDLMGVFVLYLLTREVLELLLTGFGGIGPAHWLHFPGLISHWHAALEAMSTRQRTALGVVLTALDYVLSAAPPLVYLLVLARRRGASLADEIGWNRRNFGANLLYGVGGYAIAWPLMILVMLLGKEALKHAPDPSNPAIPMLAGASSVWVTLLLVLLATVAAPLLEELFFRGVFYNAAKLRVGVWPAIILTGLVFGFVHPVGIAEMLVIAVLGGVFAWMAETRKSLLPGILGHCLQNLTTTLFLLFALAG